MTIIASKGQKSFSASSSPSTSSSPLSEHSFDLFRLFHIEYFFSKIIAPFFWILNYYLLLKQSRNHQEMLSQSSNLDMTTSIVGQCPNRSTDLFEKEIELKNLAKDFVLLLLFTTYDQERKSLTSTTKYDSNEFDQYSSPDFDALEDHPYHRHHQQKHRLNPFDFDLERKQSPFIQLDPQCSESIKNGSKSYGYNLIEKIRMNLRSKISENFNDLRSRNKSNTFIQIKATLQSIMFLIVFILIIFLIFFFLTKLLDIKL